MASVKDKENSKVKKSRSKNSKIASSENQNTLEKNKSVSTILSKENEEAVSHGPQQSKSKAKPRLGRQTFNFSDESDDDEILKEFEEMKPKLARNPLKEQNQQPCTAQSHQALYTEALHQYVTNVHASRSPKSVPAKSKCQPSHSDWEDLLETPHCHSKSKMSSGKKKLFTENNEEIYFQSTPKESRDRRKQVNLFLQKSVLRNAELEATTNASVCHDAENLSEHDIDISDFVEVQDESVQTSFQPEDGHDVWPTDNEGFTSQTKPGQIAKNGSKVPDTSNSSSLFSTDLNSCSAEEKSISDQLRFKTSENDCGSCLNVSVEDQNGSHTTAQNSLESNKSVVEDIMEDKQDKPSLSQTSQGSSQSSQNYVEVQDASVQVDQEGSDLNSNDSNGRSSDESQYLGAEQDLDKSSKDLNGTSSGKSQHSDEEQKDLDKSSKETSSDNVQHLGAGQEDLDRSSKDVNGTWSGKSQHSDEERKDLDRGSALDKSKHSDEEQEDIDLNGSLSDKSQHLGLLDDSSEVCADVAKAASVSGNPEKETQQHHNGLPSTRYSKEAGQKLSGAEENNSQDSLFSQSFHSNPRTGNSRESSADETNALFVTAIEHGGMDEESVLNKISGAGMYRESASAVLVADTDSEDSEAEDKQDDVSLVKIEASDSEDVGSEEDGELEADETDVSCTKDYMSATENSLGGGGANQSSSGVSVNSGRLENNSSPGGKYSDEERHGAFARERTYKSQSGVGDSGSSGCRAAVEDECAVAEISERLEATNISRHRNRKYSDSSDDDDAFEKFLNKMKAPAQTDEKPPLETPMEDLIVDDDGEESEEISSDSSKSSEDEMFHVRMDNVIDSKRRRKTRLEKASDRSEESLDESQSDQDEKRVPKFEMSSDDDDLLDDFIEDGRKQNLPPEAKADGRTTSSKSILESTDSAKSCVSGSPHTPHAESKVRSDSQTTLDDNDDDGDDVFKTPFKTPRKPARPLKTWELPFETPADNRRVKSLEMSSERGDQRSCPVTVSRVSHRSRESNIGLDDDAFFLKSLSEDYPDYKRHPEASRYVKRFKDKRGELTKRLFVIYNKSVFKEQLPADLDIEWSALYRKTAGTFCYKKSSEPSAKVTLSVKVCDRAERVRDTLAHELCHAAVRLINGVRESHGPVWRSWAQRVNRAYPFMPVIARCHDYVIATKYTYKCTRCNYRIGRHSKSLDTDKKVCGHCMGQFEVFLTRDLTSSEGGDTPATPRTPRTPNKFALFVKESYSEVKGKDSSLKHGDVMKILSQQFAEKNKVSD